MTSVTPPTPGSAAPVEGTSPTVLVRTRALARRTHDEYRYR